MAKGPADIVALLAPVALLGCGARSALDLPELIPPPQCVDQPSQAWTIPGTIRDFGAAHPDFEEAFLGEDPGIVAGELGADGIPVYAGADGNPSTSGKGAFDQWYRDVPGVNAGKAFELTLEPAPTDLVFDSAAFFPIDDDLLGNEGRDHNYHFTLELHATFFARGGEVFYFEGDDDLWAFVDGGLALDLGGVHSIAAGTVDMDALDVRLGELHALDLFYAERHTIGSVLRVRFHEFVLCEQ